jgi:hypothetical protein
MACRIFKGMLFLNLFWVLAVGATGQQAQHPYRGSIPWSFVLCKFSDSPAPPHDVTYYEQMLMDSGTKGLADYVAAVSYGAADLDGSSVHGWYTEPYTTAYEKNLTASTNPNAKNGRRQRLQDCLAAAAADHDHPYTPPAGNRVYVVTSPGLDEVGFEDCCSVAGDTTALPEFAHEFGHGIDLEHSFSNDPDYQNACWSQIGEYDNQWDLMSAANIYVDPTHDFGGGPPFLDAYHVDEMGWLPQSRVFTLGLNGILEGTVSLAALTHPEAAGYHLVRVPFDANDPFHYYTIEYRTVDSWDSGIPENIVMINEVKLNPNNHLYQTFLIRAAGTPKTCQTCTPALTHACSKGNGAVSQTVNANGVSISVESTGATQASVKVSTEFALPCAQGYVWRSATPRDRTCVPPSARTQAEKDNAEAASHHLPGSDTCVNGYVWRQTDPQDHVCVTRATYDEVQSETAQSYNNVNQLQATYGPNACSPGYVWRNIDDQDYVCVSYNDRAQAQADNAAAGSRHVKGSDKCVEGFVWRSAFPKDHVCVTGATREYTQTENQQGPSHQAKSNT